MAAGRIIYTEYPRCREELLCCQCFALGFHTWSSAILTTAMWSSGQALKLLWDVGYIFWSLASDQFKADTVTANYTTGTSQGLLLWPWSQRTWAFTSWKTEKCPVELPFPIRSSFFSLHCFYWYFEIFEDWGYFLPDYSQPYKSILSLQQVCRGEGLDVHQVQKATENILFSPEKNGKWRLSFALKDDTGSFLKKFLLRSDPSPVRDGSGVQELQAAI